MLVPRVEGDRMPVATTPGLSSAVAAARRDADGPNRLPEPRRPSALRRLSRELTHFFAVMLWVAGVLALLAGLPELGVAIVAVILLNAVFAFAQQTRADHAAERLRAMLPTRVSVWRDQRRPAAVRGVPPTPWGRQNPTAPGSRPAGVRTSRRGRGS